MITADGPGCGGVRLETQDVTVRVCSDDASGASTFRGAGRAAAVSHEANAGVSDLLVSVRGHRVEWRRPDELADRPGGPAPTTDDLLNFHLLLQHDEDWNDAVAALIAGADRRRDETLRA